ncbi:MAG TPA: hypothetical protein VGF30_09950 [Bacteroidia bacterium]
MKTIATLICLLAFVLKGRSQDILSSSISIETCMDSIDCYSGNNSGILFYDETKSALYLRVNFNDEKDSIIQWYKGLPEDNLYFKVVVPPDFFKNTALYDKKVIPLTGLIFYNGYWQPQKVDVGLFVTESSNLVIDTKTDPYQFFKINFAFTLLLSEFEEFHAVTEYHEIISVGLSSGRINELKPGMEPLLGAAYNHE